MPRISGVELPENKQIKISLTHIYGIGHKKALDVLNKSGIDKNKRTSQLTDQELNKIQKELSSISTEGGLKKIVSENIKRLKQINSYRGLRHSVGLPVRGQRTRVNARTKRGKRVTIGALKKDAMTKLEAAKKVKEKSS